MATLNEIRRLAKPCKWVREFRCKCGGWHKVVGKRNDLNKLQQEAIDRCVNA